LTREFGFNFLSIVIYGLENPNPAISSSTIKRPFVHFERAVLFVG
jgi:hypothetical protein